MAKNPGSLPDDLALSDNDPITNYAYKNNPTMSPSAAVHQPAYVPVGKQLSRLRPMEALVRAASGGGVEDRVVGNADNGLPPPLPQLLSSNKPGLSLEPFPKSPGLKIQTPFGRSTSNPSLVQVSAESLVQLQNSPPPSHRPKGFELDAPISCSYPSSSSSSMTVSLISSTSSSGGLPGFIQAHIGGASVEHKLGQKIGKPEKLRGPKTEEDSTGSEGGERSEESTLPLNGEVKRYTPEERKKKIARWKAKKPSLKFNSYVRYECRKDFAVTRRRVGGRFVAKTPEEKAAHERKKQEEKAERLRLRHLKKEMKKRKKEEEKRRKQQERRMKQEARMQKKRKTEVLKY
jgi:hypothetical protein